LNQLKKHTKKFGVYKDDNLNYGDIIGRSSLLDMKPPVMGMVDLWSTWHLGAGKLHEVFVVLTFTILFKIWTDMLHKAAEMLSS
jgi:hypothetical protein